MANATSCGLAGEHQMANWLVSLHWDLGVGEQFGLGIPDCRRDVSELVDHGLDLLPIDLSPGRCLTQVRLRLGALCPGLSDPRADLCGVPPASMAAL
jgi:hypothetical protein